VYKSPSSRPQHAYIGRTSCQRTLRIPWCGSYSLLSRLPSFPSSVPKSYIVNSSPVLDELIRRSLDPPDDTRDERSLPVIQLPESGATLHSLFTFTFPVTPLLPSTTENVMELLSVAQKYQMVSILAHIRGSIALQNPPSIQKETALHVYSLAQKYGLHHEALQAARYIFKYPMNIEDKVDVVQGAALYELWNYYENFRAVLKLELTVFRSSSARGTLAGLHCVELASSQIPCWLDNYIASIRNSPNLFDIIEFNTILARHIKDESQNLRCQCSSIPSKTIRNFWEALASVVRGCFEKVNMFDVVEPVSLLKSFQAESALVLVQEREDSQPEVNSNISRLEPLDVPDANLILRSSDLVDFRVHKSLLAMASPFFKDLLSLPQPSDSEPVDGLPVVQLPEDAELLRILVSMLYPVCPVTPNSYDKVLYLLAACQKYDMVQVQSSIRAEVNRGSFPVPVGTEAFRAYAIASSKGLVPETEDAARRTLDYPMTFKCLGEGLRSFEGWALRDVAHFRKRCADNLVTCLESFLQVRAPGPSNIWVGCPGDTLRSRMYMSQADALPSWLRQILSQKNDNLKLQTFTLPLASASNIRGEYLSAIQSHAGCKFCSLVHARNGPTYYTKLESELAQARNKVHTFLSLL